MDGERVHSLYGQGRYGVVPPSALDIVAICVLLNQLPHHIIDFLRDSHQMLPASKSRVLTTAEASQVGAFRFDLLIWERCVHLLQPLMLDWRGATGMADGSSPCGWVDFVVSLSLFKWG